MNSPKKQYIFLKILVAQIWDLERIGMSGGKHTYIFNLVPVGGGRLGGGGIQMTSLEGSFRFHARSYCNEVSAGPYAISRPVRTQGRQRRN